MKALKIVLGIIVGIVFIYLLMAVFMSSDCRVERSIEINKPVADVYNEVRYFGNFKNWSPWLELDPDMTVIVSNTDGEVGSKYNWASKNNKAGSGSMTRTKQEENKQLESDLRIADWEGVSKAGYTFEPAGSGTKVTWYLQSDLPLLMRPMCLMMDMQAGKDFKKGLEKMKAHMEKK